MSPSFVNDNEHAVYVKQHEDDSKPLLKVPSGHVVDATGLAADSLDDTNGVRKLSAADAKKLREGVAGPTPEQSPEGRRAEAVALAHGALGLLSVAAPLHVVIGDDQAPFGPASGEVSTKVEQAERDDTHRRQFAEGEALPGDAIAGVDTPPVGALAATGAEVHNEQAESRARVEEVVRDGLDETAADDS